MDQQKIHINKNKERSSAEHLLYLLIPILVFFAVFTLVASGKINIK